MTSRSTNTVERAFELAKSGSCRTLDDIVRLLKKEGFPSVEAHIAGRAIRLDLRNMMRAHLAGTAST